MPLEEADVLAGDMQRTDALQDMPVGDVHDTEALCTGSPATSMTHDVVCSRVQLKDKTVLAGDA